MSSIHDNIRRLDTALDNLKQQINDSYLTTLELTPETEQAGALAQNINALGDVLDSLSVPSKSPPLLRAKEIADLIAKLHPASIEQLPDAGPLAAHTANIWWLVAGKAAIQTLGAILATFLEQGILLNDEILYWEDVLGSHWYIAFYALQTSPFRLWHKVTRVRSSRGEGTLAQSAQGGWMHFYDSVRRCINAREQRILRGKILSILSGNRTDVRRKRTSLKTMKNFNATGIGLLLREFFPSGTDDVPPNWANGEAVSKSNWRGAMYRGVAAMETLLRIALDDARSPNFAETVVATVDEASTASQSTLQRPTLHMQTRVIERLDIILRDLLPRYTAASTSNMGTYGRPSRVVRYWLPLCIGALSASTSLRLLYNRRYELVDWISDIGSTAVDFWTNWVVEPIQRLIGTIRHDDKSEIALMSKNSLEADRASLERMVVDFVRDHGTLEKRDSTIDTSLIADKVREGDLTPVLMAYEKDLRSPFIGTLRGDLVRALLIQIQKTKVDVEIAIGGIDSLLRSQELVFGFVGLTPGILVSYACLQWLWRTFGNRRGLRVGRQQDDLRHALRYVMFLGDPSIKPARYRELTGADLE
ncbi:ATP synthase regulation protein NCA2-domain-containing protein [Aspergillus ambiguus]|uniref:NCA2 family protein n=1 Tax=Aspergillus ambiguus TaxID=176160 RepID=UPI003CCE0F1F